MFGQEKKLLEKFRFKFMDAYIHIRVNLNSHECLCDKNGVYNGMYIYMVNLKLIFFLDRILFRLGGMLNVTSDSHIYPKKFV